MEKVVITMHDRMEAVYKGRKVLVTGHTGFKGPWLSLWLIEMGAEVIGYAQDPATSPSLFKIIELQNRLLSIEGDVRDFMACDQVFKAHQPEIVFHLAAQSLVRRSYLDPVGTFTTNVLGTMHILEACRRTPSVRAVVIVTSDKCYENREWLWSYREIDRLGGHDPYSSSKACAELVTASYRKSFFRSAGSTSPALGLSSARAGNVIGGGDWSEDRLIPDCIRAFQDNKPIQIRHPHALRPWQHVLEPVYGYLLLASKLYQHGAAYSGSWNFGPDEHSVKPVARIVEDACRLWGHRASWYADAQDTPHEASVLKLDCSKARTELGWQPRWNIKEAMSKAIEWYKEFYNGCDMKQYTLDQIAAYKRVLMEPES